MQKGVNPTQKQILSTRPRRAELKRDELAGKWIPQRFNGSWMMTWRDMWPFITAAIASITIGLLIP